MTGQWELVQSTDQDFTERMEIPGGWLYRLGWRRHMGVGRDELNGSAVTFVPAVEVLKELAQRIVSAQSKEPANGA